MHERVPLPLSLLRLTVIALSEQDLRVEDNSPGDLAEAEGFQGSSP
jgi:hypothetical protein